MATKRNDDVYERNVISMEWDAEDFDKGIQRSTEYARDFRDEVDFNDIDYDEYGQEIDKISIRFDALRIAAEECMRRIVNAAVNAGEKLVKALSIDNIASGYDKYMQKVAAVQTMMATNSSLTIEQINTQMEKLEWFTDETSYDLANMQASMSKFMAAGVELDKAGAAVQGIALWAAESGQNAQGATRAMYQLSQALGSGVIRWQDWMSIANLNMDTAPIEKRLVEEAQRVGTLSAQGLTTSFKDSLQKGWLTTDVFLNVMGQYSEFTDYVYEHRGDYETVARAIDALKDSWTSASGAAEKFAVSALKAAQEAKTFTEAFDAIKTAVASTWAKTFEYIIGPYETVKGNMTDFADLLYQIFVDSTITDALAEWDEKTAGKGRQKLWKGFLNIMQRLLDIVNTVRDALSEIFPPATVSSINKVVDKFVAWTETLLADAKFLNLIRFSTKAVAQALRLILSLVRAIWAFALPIINFIIEIAEGIGEIIAQIFELNGGTDELLDNVNEFLSDTDKISAGVQKVIDKIKAFWAKLDTAFFENTDKHITEWLVDIGQTLLSVFGLIGEIFTILFADDVDGGLAKKVSDLFGAIGDMFSAVWDGLKENIGIIFENIVDLAPAILHVLASGSTLIGKILQLVLGIVNFILDWLNTLNPATLVALLAVVFYVIKTILAWRKWSTLLDLFASASWVLDSIGDTINSLKWKVRSEMILQWVRQFAFFILSLSAALWIMQQADFESQTLPALIGIAAMLGVLTLCVRTLAKLKISKTNITKMMSLRSIIKTLTHMMIEMTLAMSVLALAANEGDDKVLLAAGVTIAGMLFAIVGIIAILEKIKNKSVGKNMQNVVKIFVNLSGVVIAMMLALSVLAVASKENSDKTIRAALLMLSVLMAEIYFLTRKMVLLTQMELDSKKMTQIMLLFMGISLMATAMMLALSALVAAASANGSGGDIIGAISAVAGIIGAIMGIVGSTVTLANQLTDSKKMLEFSAAVSIMVGSFVTMILALALLASVSNEYSLGTIIAALSGIVVLLGIFIGIGFIIKAMLSNMYSAAALAAALAIVILLAGEFAAFGGALVALGAGIDALTDASKHFQEAGANGGSIVETLLELFALGGMGSIAAIGLMATAAALTTLAAGISAVAVAIALFNKNSEEKKVTEKANTVGKSIVDGISNALTGGLPKLFNLGGLLGDNTLEGLRKAIDAHSPSKKAVELGGYFVEGFANGIGAMAPSADAAANYVGESSLSAMQKALNNALQFSNDGVGELTIRPVMDLSNVQNGVNAINNMGQSINGYSFNGSYSLAERANRSMRGGGYSGSIDNSYSSADTTINVSVDGAGAVNADELAERISQKIQSKVNSRRRASGIQWD